MAMQAPGRLDFEALHQAIEGRDADEAELHTINRAAPRPVLPAGKEI